MTPLVELFELQSRWAASHGSAIYGTVLAGAARALRGEGPGSSELQALLAPYAGARRGDAVPLRFVGGLHRLALSGAAPQLAGLYPSTGGSPDQDRLWPAALLALQEHPDVIAGVLARPPQTNEPGRAVALWGALEWLWREQPGTPVDLYELGSSAGLLLRPDGLADAGMFAGNEPPWQGGRGAGRTPIRVRRGCDPDPVDPLSEDGALTLKQYVWPEDLHRMERLALAIEVARQIPASVVRESAPDFTAEIQLAPGRITVLWHSVMWRYLDDDQRSAILGDRDRLAAAATPTAPFAHVWFETEVPDGSVPDPGELANRTEGHTARLQAWTGKGEGRNIRLGFGHPHGLPIRWLQP